MDELRDEQMWWAVEAGDEGSESGTNDQQGIINMYVTMMLQLLQLDPYMAIRYILEQLATTGPFFTQTEILEEFGGWTVFRRTLQRMEVVRARVVNDNLTSLPMTTDAPADEPFGLTIPETDGFIAWWAPQVEDGAPPFLFSVRIPEGEELRRYPHMGAYTDEHASDGEDEQGKEEITEG